MQTQTTSSHSISFAPCEASAATRSPYNVKRLAGHPKGRPIRRTCLKHQCNNFKYKGAPIAGNGSAIKQRYIEHREWGLLGDQHFTLVGPSACSTSTIRWWAPSKKKLNIDDVRRPRPTKKCEFFFRGRESVFIRERTVSYS
ncbi:hypothetical protein QR680_011292 [Steinernema hermaphroditum]|uniref:Uncharacterized protein n=1 Tax=Steinernema hermaphroditum TaxID=289476 RepID=A0AA39IT73_9BILA|nr:hypothetical protein QR680_011292 [Steinernema hermaphroditum]